MLNKDQAFAAMDALISRAESERKDRIDRRTRRFTRLYPELRNAPLEERPALLHSASTHSARCLIIPALAMLATVGIVMVIFLPDSTMGLTVILSVTALGWIFMILLAVILYRLMRSFIAREVAARFQNGTEMGGASGV